MHVTFLHTKHNFNKITEILTSIFQTLVYAYIECVGGSYWVALGTGGRGGYRQIFLLLFSLFRT